MFASAKNIFKCSSIFFKAPVAMFPGKFPCVPLANQYSDHKEIWGQDYEYKSYLGKIREVLSQHLNDANRFQSIAEREDRSDLKREGIMAQCIGRYFITHRGFPVVKTADDMLLTQLLLWYLKPATVIELGTFSGGSALWLTDMLRVMDIPSNVYSMDIDLSNVSDELMQLKTDNLTFLEGDSNHIEKTFTPEFLKGLQHPWLVIEDSHTNIYNILKYFRNFMHEVKTVFGSYLSYNIIAEDLSPDIPNRFGCGRIYPNLPFQESGFVGLNILKQFLSDFNEEVAVDSFYTDCFGYNGTWNWHGYIRKMK